ncbi:MAG: OmpA family protein [Candidatus Kapaibacteriota bacterium]
MKKIVIYTFFSVFLLTGCASIMNREAELPELPPPSNYSPNFIQNSKDINNIDKNDIDLEITRYEINDDEKATVYFHLVGNKNSYLSNATTNNILKRFCGGKLLTEESEIPIDKLIIKESNIKDRSPLAIAIVLDHSGSMGEDRAYDCQDAVISFLKSKNSKDLVSIIKYDQRVAAEVPLTQSSDYALNNLKRNGLLDFGGMTAISDAIIAGINQLMRTDKSYKRVLIIFTDGWDNSSNSTMQEAITQARKNGIIINAIDYGYGINEGFMQQFAQNTGGYYKHIYKKDEFKLLFTDILKRFEYFYTTQINLPEFGEYKFVMNYCLENKVLSDTITINNVPHIGDITLLNVYYDTDKFNLKPESMKAIKRVAKLMKAFPTIEIEISGHTDSQNRTNIPDYNIKLSQNRANEVRNALINEGIDPSRIIAKGYGDTLPVADNSTNEGRALNRRTEFIILKK